MAKTHDEVEHSALLQQFHLLRGLSDGWYDGAGKALDDHALGVLETWILEAFPSKLPVPAIVPTPEGDVLMEWDAAGDPSLDIQLSSFCAYFHVFLQDGSDLERTYDLNSQAQRTELLDFLEEKIGGQGA